MAIASPRKQSVHHKRAHGQHHHQDKHYLKAYHPYLPLLMLVIVGLAINFFWNQQSAVLGDSSIITAQDLLQDTNNQRLDHNEASLGLNAQLTAAAQTKANDMSAHNYWSHNTPTGQTPWVFIKDRGYDYQIAGENLAYGFPDSPSVLTAWLNSPEHRANVLNKQYQDVGFGIATAQNFQGKGSATIIVAMYGTPVTAPPIASASIGGPAGGVSTFASTAAGAQSAQPYRTVSRIQMFTGGNAPWSLGVLIALTMVAATIFVFRHAKAWQRFWVRGEDFVLEHKTLDIVVVSLILLGVIMTRGTGFIG